MINSSLLEAMSPPKAAEACGCCGADAEDTYRCEYCKTPYPHCGTIFGVPISNREFGEIMTGKITLSSFIETLQKRRCEEIL